MGVTGWIGDDPQASEPRGAAGFTEFILANRADPGQGRTLGQVLARAAEAPDRAGPEPGDFDDRAAGLVTRGYAPGMISQLSQRLADTTAELEAERAKIEKGARQLERTRQMHERGQIDVSGVIARWQDTDEGDEDRVRKLERRADGLRRRIDEAAAMISPQQQRDADPYEAASRRAHDIFRELTRERMAEAQAGRPAARPFGSVSRGRDAVRSESCTWCTEFGVSDEQSFLLHGDPETGLPVTPPGTLAAEEQARQVREEHARAEHARAERAKRTEADRLMRLGYSQETAQLAATPYGGMAVR